MEKSMRTILKIIVICVLSVLLTIAAKANDTRGWEPKPAKNKNLFVVKADKKFLGAKVEVLYGAGEVITEQKLLKRKIMIDFDDVRIGTYTVRITKGKDVKEYQYLKK
jgi:hypothetical protein